MKLLIVEDEQDLLDLIMRYFKREGYLCEFANNFKDGYKKINNYEYDCAIIDLNLPDGDGLKLVDTLRADNTQMGILIVSARDTVDDRINGLDTGADDYLTKPFNLSELNARVKAIMRRKTNQFSKELNFKNLSINMDQRKVTASEKVLQLTKKEYNILLYLARNKNRVVTKDSIAEHLWGDYMDDAVSFDFIYAHVKNLRKKLAENGCGDFLKTVYGIGYKFQAN
ncbi:MAG: response regulator transcription factor [Saprospiraceae bacterium]|nr:response regulator transcription factor [Saprospiraceae bacterium]MDG2418984.1 response regulator transcription factor [Saprospiraceae bacterium]